MQCKYWSTRQMHGRLALSPLLELGFSTPVSGDHDPNVVPDVLSRYAVVGAEPRHFVIRTLADRRSAMQFRPSSWVYLYFCSPLRPPNALPFSAATACSAALTASRRDQSLPPSAKSPVTVFMIPNCVELNVMPMYVAFASGFHPEGPSPFDGPIRTILGSANR